MAESHGLAEHTILQNVFGTVTTKRVISFRAKGWLAGGSREDIPLQHVTSVRLDTARQAGIGFILLLVGIALLTASGGAKAVGVLLLLAALLALWGSPSVVVNTAGQDVNAAKGFPWQRADATAFVEALRSQLFKE